MQITITDEPTRMALQSALWEVIYDKLDQYSSTPFAGAIYEHAHDIALARRTSDQDRAIDAMVADFSAVHASIRQVRDAELGASLDLPVQDRELVSGFEGCIYAVESSADGETFWNLPPEQRRVASDVHDSAVRMRDALSPAEVAGGRS